MRTVTDLHDYQKKCINFQATRQHSMVWLDPGLGKTIVTLTNIEYLLKLGKIKAAVIIAPVRVCKLVWRQEALKWGHTSNLKFSMLIGTRDQRSRGLNTKADVYLINYENLKWLADELKNRFIDRGNPIPFDGIVYDEISKCKNKTTNRVRALMRVWSNFVWTTGLTGTPASNGYKDLHGQYLVVDGGKRLGTGKTKFMTKYYKNDGPYRKIAYDDTEKVIQGLIGDITIEMSAEDYNPLPQFIINDVNIELDNNLRSKYEYMERELFIQLDSGAEIELFNQASLTNKCLQFSNGAMFTDLKGNWEAVHDLKLDALEDIIDENGGKPILCSYAYRFDAIRIMERFKHLDPINLTTIKSNILLDHAISRWKSGDCPLMIGHPLSMGHGIDGLQDSCTTLVWFGLTWSLDLFKQFNSRVLRQGQKSHVICHRILTLNTLDQAQVLSLSEKNQTESSLRNAIKQYRESKDNG